MKCNWCNLCLTAKQMVLPRGSTNPKIVFIGEAPGIEEDISGKPFVGRSGKLLDQWIKYIGLDEEDYSITNVVWCRPPGNRFPTEQEKETCSKHNLKNYLSQLEVYKYPTHVKLLVPLGRLATSFLLGLEHKIVMGDYVGKEIRYFGAVNIFPLYHPSYVLRTHIDINPLLDLLKRIVFEVDSTPRTIE